MAKGDTHILIDHDRNRMEISEEGETYRFIDPGLDSWGTDCPACTEACITVTASACCYDGPIISPERDRLAQ